MGLKLSDLKTALEEIWTFEYIIYDKKENQFIFVDLKIMSTKEYNDILEKAEFDEENRYFHLPNSYMFHDSEIVEEYIDLIQDKNLQSELEQAFYGKGKYRRFKDILIRYNKIEDYYKFRDKYLTELAISWCEKNNIEFELDN